MHPQAFTEFSSQTRNLINSAFKQSLLWSLVTNTSWWDNDNEDGGLLY